MSLASFAPRAARERERAATGIAEDNADAAKAFLQAALAAAARVAAKPDLGSRRRYAPGRYRFWPVPRFPYLLVYDAETRPVVILRVARMAQDIPHLLSGPYE